MGMVPTTVTEQLPVDGWQRAVSFDGTGLAWRSDGPDTGGATVVLCNGIACSDAYWQALVPLLADDRRVVRWDYRGHGRSESPADPRQAGIDAVVRDL